MRPTPMPSAPEPIKDAPRRSRGSIDAAILDSLSAAGLCPPWRNGIFRRFPAGNYAVPEIARREEGRDIALEERREKLQSIKRLLN